MMFLDLLKAQAAGLAVSDEMVLGAEYNLVDGYEITVGSKPWDSCQTEEEYGALVKARKELRARLDALKARKASTAEERAGAQLAQRIADIQAAAQDADDREDYPAAGRLRAQAAKLRKEGGL